MPAALLTLFLAIAAHPQYRIDTWTTDNGLPQNSVTGMTRTPEGYLWLTTNDGLVRFDGVRFKVFNKSNTPELTTNRLVGAFADKSGRLWFQCEDGAVIFYEKGVFNVVMKAGEIPSFLRSPFFDDQSGGVVFYTNDKNYRYQDGKFAPFLPDGLPEESVVILADREGGLWFTNHLGVQRLQNGEIKTYDLRGVSGGKAYKVAFEDRTGGIWLGYGGGQREPDTRLLHIHDERIEPMDFPAGPVWHFAEDDTGNLWLAVYRKGVYRIDRDSVAGGKTTAADIKPVAIIDGLSTSSSGVLSPDNEGGMWLGTDKGLVRFLPQTIRFFSKKDGLTDDNVYPIYQDPTGNIWAGIWQNSLVKYQADNFKTVLKTLDTFYLTSLFTDHTGHFWIGNIDTLRYLENGRLIKFPIDGLDGDTEFSVITEDRSGGLWFGTNRGLVSYAGGRTNILTKKDGLPDEYIVALLERRDGTLWVGTRGGLASIDNGQIKTYTTADGLASNYIRSLYEDADGKLWIGTYDGGLTRYKDGRFVRLTAQDGLFSNGVFCILEDAHGWFWMNSNQGIYRVSKQDLNDFADGKTRFLTSIAYNKQDGLLSVEGNGGRQPAGIKARDGKLWFPMAEGIAVVDPETVVANRLPPPVLIDEISIDRQSVVNETFQAAIGTNQAAIKLGPNQNNLEINYTGLSFINSEQVKFKYRLRGLDDNWTEVGTRRTAYFSYLPPGDFTFEVIAANRDGVWNTTGASVKITVLPPFYRTWWFWALCAIVIGALIILIYLYRVRQLTEKAARQAEFSRKLIDSQETERGRIAAELHDGLSQSLVVIKNRAMLSLTRPDDHDRALEQLREIADASTYAIDEVKDIIYDLRPIQLDRLGLTGAIEDLVEKVADANELECGKGLDNVDNIFPKPFENSIYRIVQEALNNVVKHSAATRVDVSLVKNSDRIELTVADNGKGFILGENRSRTEKGGFGLIGIVERAKLLGGHASIESSREGGTRVSLNVPIKAFPQMDTDKEG